VPQTFAEPGMPSPQLTRRVITLSSEGEGGKQRSDLHHRARAHQQPLQRQVREEVVAWPGYISSDQRGYVSESALCRALNDGGDGGETDGQEVLREEEGEVVLLDGALEPGAGPVSAMHEQPLQSTWEQIGEEGEDDLR